MSNIRPKIKIMHSKAEDGHSPNARKFSTTKEISLSGIIVFELSHQEDENLSEKLNLLGVVGKLLLSELSTIPGIMEIYFSRYSITVWKGDAFEWEDIEDSIITALKKVFGSEAGQVKIVRVDGRQLKPLKRSDSNKAL